MQPGYETILTPEALAFVAQLHRMYNPTRLALLRARDQRQAWINEEGFIGFAPEYSSIRDDRSWQVRPAPADLADRRVEITGPCDRKMVINALNSGAQCFMACLEDASAPTWDVMVQGQVNLRDAARRHDQPRRQGQDLQAQRQDRRPHLPPARLASR